MTRTALTRARVRRIAPRRWLLDGAGPRPGLEYGPFPTRLAAVRWAASMGWTCAD